jgi:hypothetical protein
MFFSERKYKEKRNGVSKCEPRGLTIEQPWREDCHGLRQHALYTELAAFTTALLRLIHYTYICSLCVSVASTVQMNHQNKAIIESLALARIEAMT